jgi:hypothetical protein
MTLRMIITDDIGKPNADLSKIPAYSEGTAETSIYWDSLTKDQAKEFYDYAMGLFAKYSYPCAGTKTAVIILGTLEDVYPDYVAEFEAE